jgi:hypothetical protein
MTDEATAKDHHTAAATYHDLAAKHHREAARHFEFAKGWAGAAHEAFLARGYATYARKHGDEAAKKYAEKAGDPVPMSLGTP